MDGAPKPMRSTSSGFVTNTLERSRLAGNDDRFSDDARDQATHSNLAWITLKRNTETVLICPGTVVPTCSTATSQNLFRTVQGQGINDESQTAHDQG